MINAQKAFELAQSVNRANWVKATTERISSQIVKESQFGRRELHVCFKDLIVGSENLVEAGEMFVLFANELKRAGYSHVVTPSGDLIISW